MKAVFALMSLGALLASGCASVTVSLPGLGGTEEAAAPVQERVALTEALERLDASVPPEPSRKEKLGLLVFGGHERARQTAARNYLDGLRADDRLAAVFADIDMALLRARAVVAAGEAAATALVPTMDDVVLLEGAIGDVQRCGAIYVEALRQLRDAEKESEALGKRDIRAVKDAFAESVAQISAAADLVLARLESVPEQFASPELVVLPGY